MDPTLLGIIIGAIISLATTFLTQLFISKREAIQWERQQTVKEKEAAAEAAIRAKEAEQARKDYLLSLYQKSIRSLSQLLSILAKRSNHDEELQLRLQEEAQESLSLVLLHRGLEQKDPKDFFSLLRTFTEKTNEYWTRQLLIEVFNLAMHDDELYPEKLEVVEENNKKRIQANIDDEYRQQLFLVGVELPKTHTFSCSYSKLTATQRQIIWDTYFATSGQIGDHLYLRIPKFDEKKSSIVLAGDHWPARVNLLTATPEDIFQAWEDDYDRALEEARKKEKDALDAKAETPSD